MIKDCYSIQITSVNLVAASVNIPARLLRCAEGYNNAVSVI